MERALSAAASRRLTPPSLPGPSTAHTQVPVPVRDFTSSPRMIIIRSFDVNHPGDEPNELKGGVAGGSILQGVLRLGDEVEIRPGNTRRDADGRVRCSPILSRVVSLKAEKNELQFAVPGGLIGVGLIVDPTLTRADRLVGQVLGHKGALPGIFGDIDVSFYLLRRLLGVKTTEGEKAAKVSCFHARTLSTMTARGSDYKTYTQLIRRRFEHADGDIHT